MKKSISIIIALVILLAFTFTISAESVSAKTIKEKKCYCECYKVGNYVYCGNMCSPLYKVNLKTKKVKKIIGRYKGCGPHQRVYYKGYLYFFECGNGGEGPLFRANVKTDKVSALSKDIWLGFAIRNNKLYTTIITSRDKCVNAVMDLNGKNKKKTSYKVSFGNKYVSTNAKGYKLVQKNLEYKDFGGIGDPYYIPVKAKMYLKTPKNNKIYICTYNPSACL